MSQHKARKNQVRKAPKDAEVFYDEESPSQSRSSAEYKDVQKPFAFNKAKKDLGGDGPISTLSSNQFDNSALNLIDHEEQNFQLQAEMAFEIAHQKLKKQQKEERAQKRAMRRKQGNASQLDNTQTSNNSEVQLPQINQRSSPDRLLLSQMDHEKIDSMKKLDQFQEKLESNQKRLERHLAKNGEYTRDDPDSNYFDNMKVRPHYQKKNQNVMIPHMPPTSEKKIGHMKSSEPPPPRVKKAPTKLPIDKMQSVADLNEVENYNKNPQEKLGGKMCLDDLKKTDAKTVKDLVSKALTIKALKELEKVQDSDEERVENDIRRETIRSARKSNNTPGDKSHEQTDPFGSPGENQSIDDDFLDDNAPGKAIMQKSKTFWQKANLENELKDDSEFRAKDKNQSYNKAIFRKKYGVELELPAFYIQDAKLYPKNIKYCLKVVKYAIPKKNMKVLLQNGNDEPIQKSDLREQFKNNIYQRQNVVLELMECMDDEKTVRVVKRAPILDAYMVNISFSPDGKFFALFRLKRNILQIYKIENQDIEGLLNKVEKQQFFKEFRMMSALKNSQRMYFDLESRYLASFGKDTVNIMPLYTGSLDIFSTIIDKDAFECIIDIQLVSSKELDYRCDVACHQKGTKNIVIYQLHKDINFKRCVSLVEDFDDSIHEKMIVKMSRDFKTVMVSYKKENYKLYCNESEGKLQYTQQMIPQLLGKKVSKVYQIDSEFFFICFTDYDAKFKVFSLGDPKFEMRVDKMCEPGKLFALDVGQEGVVNGFGKKMVIIDIRDEEFFYEILRPLDRVKYLENHKTIKEQKIAAAQRKIDDEASQMKQGGKSARLRKFSDEESLQRMSSRIEPEPVFCKSILYNPSQGYAVMWPYIVFSGFRNSMWIFCAFNQNTLIRIQAPKQDVEYQFKNYFVTQDLICYIVMTNVDKRINQFWKLDLSQPRGFTDYSQQTFKMQKCFQYSYEDVENMPLLDFMVRSESRPDNQNEKNLKLMAFFLHSGSLYVWIQGQDQLKLVSQTGSKKLLQLNKNEIIINNDLACQKEGHSCQFVFKVFKIKLMFSSYDITVLFEEKQTIGDVLKAFSLDPVHMILTIMYKSDREKNNNSRRFKILDTRDSNKVLANIQVKDPEIIGRFRLGKFTMCDGHFYFDNEVIKIRYDVLRQPQTKRFTEKMVFDNYEGLLDLQEGETVQSNNPYLDIFTNRMFYFTRNSSKLKPKRILMLPFLHERKVYLNRMKDKHQYFYTVIQEEVSNLSKAINQNLLIKETTGKSVRAKMIVSIDFTRYTYCVYSMSGILLNKVYFSHIVEKYGKPVQVSENGENFIFQDEKDPFKINLLCLNSTELIYMKTIDIQDEMMDYITEIENKLPGSYESFEAAKMKSSIQGEFKPYFIPANTVLNFSINDKLDVTIQVSSDIEQKLYNQLSQTFNNEDIRYLRKLYELEDQLLAGLRWKPVKRSQHIEKIKKVRSQLSQNTLRILSNLDSNLKSDIKKSILSLKGSIFYVQKGNHKLQSGPELSQLQKSFIQIENKTESIDSQALFFTQDYKDHFIPGQEIRKFSSNQDYIIFWSLFEVFYLPLSMTAGHVKMKLTNIDLVVDPDEKQTFVKRVRCGSESNTIMIVINQSPHSQVFIHWDIEKNQEKQSFDASQKAIVFFDAAGDAVITDGDQVVLTDQNVCLKTFDVKKVNDSADNFFDYYKGHRMDQINHNWILFNEYISLSFSFMTLVIRDRQQKSESIFDEEDFMFDTEQYNFIINRYTCFTCDNFVGNDYEKLSFILQKMQQVDPVLLQQLHYYYEVDPHIEDKALALNEKKDDKMGFSIFDQQDEQKEPLKITPLHIAFKEGNNRCINLILQYMSKIDQNCSETIKDILPKLVECDDFCMYMKELPFQTVQMLNKQTLRIADKFNDQIVAIDRNSSSYCDGYYYRKTMNERQPDDEGNRFTSQPIKNFPVSIWAFKVQWILNTDEGKYFLEKILKSEKIELYDIPAIEVIIEFLYMHYKRVVMIYRLPIYILQLIVYFASVFLNEESENSIEIRQKLNLGFLAEILEEKPEIKGSADEWNKKLDLDNINFSHEAFILDGSSSWWTKMAKGLATLNIILTLFSAVMAIYQTYSSHKTYLRSIWAYFDFAYCVLNGFISVMLIGDDIIGIENLRIIESILSFIIIGKLIYFTQLMDEIAPLINIILKIFKDIGWFMIVFAVMLLCFSISFKLIGQNQKEEVNQEVRQQFVSELLTAFVAGNLTGIETLRELYKEEDNENFDGDLVPGYSDISGSIQHVYVLAFGDFDTDSYELGNGSQTNFLWMLFILGSFMLCLHLLNMLIAIMGETFGQNNEIQRVAQIQSHLRFVLDNSYIQPIENRVGITYLITAFLSQEDDEGAEVLSHVKETLDQMLINQKKDNEKIMQELQAIKTQNESILGN